MQHFRPETDAQVADVIQTALTERRPLEILGLGSKRGIGKPVHGDVLDLSALSGILSYDPAELVLTARAGTPLSVIDAALAEANQHFAFEPFRPGALLGTKDQTLGGLLAAGLAGPRRISSGSVRDHVLGFAGVSGRGEPFKAGGKVVKNVTGFDLSKLMAGSWGTLAVLTEVTFKTLPRPETEATLAIPNLTDAQATTFLSDAMGSAAEVSGAAFADGRALVRLDGIASSVAYRADLVKALAPRDAEMLDADASRALWAAIRDGAALAGAPGAIWRISCPPTQGLSLVAAIRQETPTEAVFDWQGGLIWAALPDLPADRLRALLSQHGTGHATLIRADAQTRRAVPCFQPQEPALAALTARVKAAFDPEGILNPGRMD